MKKYPIKESLSSYEIGSFIFKPGMKIVWNWASAACKIENGFLYVTLKRIYREKGIVYFEAEETTNVLEFNTCVNSSFDLRPYNIRPRTIDDLDIRFNKAFILKTKLDYLNNI